MGRDRVFREGAYPEHAVKKKRWISKKAGTLDTPNPARVVERIRLVQKRERGVETTNKLLPLHREISNEIRLRAEIVGCVTKLAEFERDMWLQQPTIRVHKLHPRQGLTFLFSISVAGMLNKTRTWQSDMLQELSYMNFAAILRETRMEPVFSFFRDPCAP